MSWQQPLPPIPAQPLALERVGYNVPGYDADDPFRSSSGVLNEGIDEHTTFDDIDSDSTPPPATVTSPLIVPPPPIPTYGRQRHELTQPIYYSSHYSPVQHNRPHLVPFVPPLQSSHQQLSIYPPQYPPPLDESIWPRIYPPGHSPNPNQRPSRIRFRFSSAHPDDGSLSLSTIQTDGQPPSAAQSLPTEPSKPRPGDEQPSQSPAAGVVTIPINDRPVSPAVQGPPTLGTALNGVEGRISPPQSPVDEEMNLPHHQVPLGIASGIIEPHSPPFVPTESMFGSTGSDESSEDFVAPYRLVDDDHMYTFQPIPWPTQIPWPPESTLHTPASYSGNKPSGVRLNDIRSSPLRMPEPTVPNILPPRQSSHVPTRAHHSNRPSRRTSLNEHSLSWIDPVVQEYGARMPEPMVPQFDYRPTAVTHPPPQSPGYYQSQPNLPDRWNAIEGASYFSVASFPAATNPEQVPPAHQPLPGSITPPYQNPVRGLWIFKHTKEIAQEIYNLFLLRLPSLYYLRVIRIFTEADLTLGQLKKMVLVTAAEEKSTGLTTGNPVDIGGQKESIPPAFDKLKQTWESFIDSVMREWKTFNVISVLLLS